MPLRQDLDLLSVDLFLPETEETWDRIANSVNMLADLCQNGACDSPEEFVPAMKSLSRPLINALSSERTRLSGPAIELLAAVATGLGSDFDPLLPIFFPPLLSLCSRANKVVVARAKACILTVIQSTQLPSILPHLLQHSKDKASSLRLVVAHSTLACLNCFNPPDLEKEPRARDIESLISTTAKDAAAEVRKGSRDIFEAYRLLLPARVASFSAPLSPTIKKYLGIKSNQSGLDARTTLVHRLNSSLATSTSSSRSMADTVQERSKSSFNSLSKTIVKPLEPNKWSQFPFPAPSSSAAVTNQVHRDEAQRIPISRSQMNASQSRSTQFPAVKDSTTDAREPSGPKRIPLPEATSVAPTQHKGSRTRNQASQPVTSSNLIPTLKSSEVLADKINSAKGLRSVGPKKITNSLPHPRSMEQTSTKSANAQRMGRSVSRPTQSQIAKAGVIVKDNPIKSSKVESRIGVKRALNPKRIETSDTPNSVKPSNPPSVTQLVLTPSGASAVDFAQQANNAEPSQSQRDQNELRTPPSSSGSTPRKEYRDDELLVDKTPITALLTSIEQGFLLSPFSPLSPPQFYLDQKNFVDNAPFPLRLTKKEGLKVESESKNELPAVALEAQPTGHRDG